MKYVKVMDGLKSNAGDFEYKLGEVNIANNWNPNADNPLFNYQIDQWFRQAGAFIDDFKYDNY